ncbi:hypothetical protein [Mucilaginibacter segetis]|uniref:Uncharacterized protein n=1 Tax=Mucilaginibacter segetis TaxID=2793071 RepID=A0A934PRN9_9SPHI|nr:hypothetical protein [Mucilaginibacter segetis]MBK0377713.1 hypothetical protein [Mucilaginibacter segetis]
MKQQLAYSEILPNDVLEAKTELYKGYADMLLGYIFEVVKNQEMAEQYLADLFNELTFSDIQEMTMPEVNTYCRLQDIARRKLMSFFNSVDDCGQKLHTNNGTVIRKNRFIDLMDAQQQHVFCGIHYNGKSISVLAHELNTCEADIKKILKESFTIIRKNRNVAGLH